MDQIRFWNAILAFADDTLVTSENIFDLRKTINCLELEIKKTGVQFNPKKCSIMIYNHECEKPEDLTNETYSSETLNKSITYPDHVTYRAKKSLKERKKL